MTNANLRNPGDARKLWCATSNQMCRADECGHWLMVGDGREPCEDTDDGAAIDLFISATLGKKVYSRQCEITGRCGLIHG